MKKRISLIILLMLILTLGLSACGTLRGVNASPLTASGYFSATQVNIAPETGGRVVSVSVKEGDQVLQGDELFRLDTVLLEAQRDQTEASVRVAEEALKSAQTQYERVLQGERLQDRQNRLTRWNTPQPSQFELPIWYFDKQEEIASAQAELDAAEVFLAEEKANLQRILADSASESFINAESRLANAQTTFLIAEEVLDLANNAEDNEDLVDFAQDQYDVAETELGSAQTNYDRLLTTQAAQDVLEGRARVRIAQERYDFAFDHYASLQTGEESLQVQSAEAGVNQAEASLLQAQSALNLIDVQLEKTVVNAPMDGYVLAQNLDVGEMLSPGGVVMVIGKLEELELTVYIPVTEYGQVRLGDEVSIEVDSFPGTSFTGTITYISDQAEFTPRNVQTIEGRQSTVYAIRVTVPNPDLRLKPGMPADVTFGE
jgi:multidrug resistance efflux pump